MALMGRYELREQIGEGAMAEVWRAHDPGIDRVLAVKILKSNMRSDPECCARFLLEAKAAGALAHPSIVTIYDVGEVDAVPYIAMELLEGQSLDQILVNQGALTAERVLSIGTQLASALSYAHLSGLVHRDIKPSNIMLLNDGRTVKILDFGIARVIEANAVANQDVHVQTTVGQVLGTPRYMSPEQALGREIDGRSDLFSLGAVLYELVTGSHAFNAPTSALLALQITQQDPATIASVAPNCPGGLRYIIDKLLAKRPERRFASGIELSRALERECKAYEAVQADAAARGLYLPLQARVMLTVVLGAFLALAVSIGLVLHRQYDAMERMTFVSGASIASFVASNAALTAVENAGLPQTERDWAPVQAFIAAASKDDTVRWMTMVDNAGIIRGSSEAKLIGKPYHIPPGEAVVYRSGETTVTDVALPEGHSGFRFVHPISYAGKRFGMIEVSMSKTGLEAAAETSRMLLIGLGIVVLAGVAGASYFIAGLINRPVRRLKAALRDGAMGDLDFRISHHRKDEFGELFDAFNLFATAMQERLEAGERPAEASPSLDETRIIPKLSDPVRAKQIAQSDPSGTPFASEWRKSA